MTEMRLQGGDEITRTRHHSRDLPEAPKEVSKLMNDTSLHFNKSFGVLGELMDQPEINHFATDIVRAGGLYGYRFLDLGCAPGGFMGYLLSNHGKCPPAVGGCCGVTLPTKSGGFPMIFSDDRVTIQFKDLLQMTQADLVCPWVELVVADAQYMDSFYRQMGISITRNYQGRAVANRSFGIWALIAKEMELAFSRLKTHGVFVFRFGWRGIGADTHPSGAKASRKQMSKYTKEEEWYRTLTYWLMVSLMSLFSTVTPFKSEFTHQADVSFYVVCRNFKRNRYQREGWATRLQQVVNFFCECNSEDTLVESVKEQMFQKGPHETYSCAETNEYVIGQCWHIPSGSSEMIRRVDALLELVGRQRRIGIESRKITNPSVYEIRDSPTRSSRKKKLKHKRLSDKTENSVVSGSTTASEIDPKTLPREEANDNVCLSDTSGEPDVLHLTAAELTKLLNHNPEEPKDESDVANLTPLRHRGLPAFAMWTPENDYTYQMLDRQRQTFIPVLQPGFCVQQQGSSQECRHNESSDPFEDVRSYDNDAWPAHTMSWQGCTTCPPCTTNWVDTHARVHHGDATFWCDTSYRPPPCVRWQREYQRTVRAHPANLARKPGSLLPTAIGTFQAYANGFAHTVTYPRPSDKDAQVRISGQKYKNSKTHPSQEVGGKDERSGSQFAWADAEVPSTNDDTDDAKESSDSVTCVKPLSNGTTRGSSIAVEYKDEAEKTEKKGTHEVAKRSHTLLGSSPSTEHKEEPVDAKEKKGPEVERRAHAITCKLSVNDTVCCASTTTEHKDQPVVNEEDRTRTAAKRCPESREITTCLKDRGEHSSWAAFLQTHHRKAAPHEPTCAHRHDQRCGRSQTSTTGLRNDNNTTAGAEHGGKGEWMEVIRKPALSRKKEEKTVIVVKPVNISAPSPRNMKKKSKMKNVRILPEAVQIPEQPSATDETQSLLPATQHVRSRLIEILFRCIFIAYVLFRVLVVYAPMVHRVNVRENAYASLVNVCHATDSHFLCYVADFFWTLTTKKEVVA